MTLEEAQLHCRALMVFISVHCFTEDSEIPSYHELRSIGIDKDGWCVCVPSTGLIKRKDEYYDYIKNNELSQIGEGERIFV